MQLAVKSENWLFPASVSPHPPPPAPIATPASTVWWETSDQNFSVFTFHCFPLSATYTNLVEYVSKSMDALVKNHAHLDNALATLSYSEHSIGVQAVL